MYLFLLHFQNRVFVKFTISFALTLVLSSRPASVSCWMHGRPAAFTRALRSTSTMTRVDRYFSRRSILFATLLLPILATTVTADLTRYETCYLRCIAGCVQVNLYTLLWLSSTKKCKWIVMDVHSALSQQYAYNSWFLAMIDEVSIIFRTVPLWSPVDRCASRTRKSTFV